MVKRCHLYWHLLIPVRRPGPLSTSVNHLPLQRPPLTLGPREQGEDDLEDYLNTTGASRTPNALASANNGELLLWVAPPPIQTHHVEPPFRRLSEPSSRPVQPLHQQIEIDPPGAVEPIRQPHSRHGPTRSLLLRTPSPSRQSQRRKVLHGSHIRAQTLLLRHRCVRPETGCIRSLASYVIAAVKTTSSMSCTTTVPSVKAATITSASDAIARARAVCTGSVLATLLGLDTRKGPPRAVTRLTTNAHTFSLAIDISVQVPRSHAAPSR